ncbi:MAG: hypothetical protein KAX49_03210 [Halanaerobiales bacterium]|nr:hypothetical protein [Halanaerobiales bacterium]
MYASFNDTLGLIIIVIVFGVIIMLMCVQSRFTEKIRRDLEIQKEAIESSKTEAENILNKLKYSIETLRKFSFDLKDNINATGDISKKVTAAFNEITANIESQVDILSDIGNVVNSETEDVKRIVNESNSMKIVSGETLNMAYNGEKCIKDLAEEMEKVTVNVSEAVSLTNDLTFLANNIGNILSSINNISEEINLLALNAAIEAARAGEHGRNTN